MALLEAVDEALQYVITWVANTYSGLRDSINISEWSVLALAVAVIWAIIGIGKGRRKH